MQAALAARGAGLKRGGPVHRLTGFMAENVYIVENGDGLVLVDTGAPASRRLVTAKVNALGRSLMDVTHILLTHFHVDHAGGASGLAGLSGAAVCAHSGDAPYLCGDDYVRSVYWKGILGRASLLVPGAAHSVTRVPPVPVDLPLEDGQVLDILGGVEVIHGPGHTPGSVSYYLREGSILFTGDVVINTYRFLTPPTVGFSVDYEEALRSIRVLVDRLEEKDVSVVCPGHGPVVDRSAPEKLGRLRDRVSRKES